MEVSVEEESKSISDIAEEDIEELNKEDQNENLNLDNLESLKVERKPNIYQTDQAYTFQENKERIDVFIKNYLMKFNMEKSLKVFEQEFYERLSKGEISLEKIGTVPEVYIKSEQIQKKIGNFQKDLDAAKIYSEKANSKFLKLRRAKENEKIRHRRVQQEKQLLIKEIDKMKKIYKQDNDIYKELQLNEEILEKKTIKQNENQFMEESLKMKTSKFHSKDLVNLLWQMLDLILMGLNFSLLLLYAIGLLENMLFLGELLKVWMLFQIWRNVVLQMVKLNVLLL